MLRDNPCVPLKVKLNWNCMFISFIMRRVKICIRSAFSSKGCTQRLDSGIRVFLWEVKVGKHLLSLQSCSWPDK